MQNKYKHLIKRLTTRLVTTAMLALSFLSVSTVNAADYPISDYIMEFDEYGSYLYLNHIKSANKGLNLIYNPTWSLCSGDLEPEILANPVPGGGCGQGHLIFGWTNRAGGNGNHGMWMTQPGVQVGLDLYNPPIGDLRTNH